MAVTSKHSICKLGLIIIILTASFQAFSQENHERIDELISERNFEEAIHWTLSALDLYKNNNTYRKLFKEDAEYRLARLIRKHKQAL
jgi:hypothetical protein